MSENETPRWEQCPDIDTFNDNSSQISLNLHLPLRERIWIRLQALAPVLFIRLYALDWRKNRKTFWRHILRDVIAGLTMGAILVPQAMSFATVAGLLPVYGLYNSFVGLLPYPIFGTSSHLVPGPTALMSILVKRSIPGSVDGSSVSQELHQYLSFVLACFAGVLQLTLGAMGLGYMSNLIAEPVVAGFTSAAAILIIATQFPALFGSPSCTRDDGDACTILDAVQNVYDSKHIMSLSIPICSLVSVILLVAFKKFFRQFPRTKLLSSLGPLVLIAIAVPMTYHLDYKNGHSNTCVLRGHPPCGEGVVQVMGACCVPANPFVDSRYANYSFTREVQVYDLDWNIRQIGPISPGLPSFLFPFRQCTNDLDQEVWRSISVMKNNVTSSGNDTACVPEQVVVNNNGSIFPATANFCSLSTPDSSDSHLINMTIQETTHWKYQQCVTFSTMRKLVYSSVMVAFIGYMESITIAKIVARQFGSDSVIRPSNELFALGMSNLFCSMLQGYPVTGSMTRTAINGEAGAYSSLSLVFCALVVLICLQFLTRALAYMPKFVLGAIVLEAVVKLVDLEKPKFLWRTDKRDFVVLMVTFTVVLFVAIEDGVILGILLSWLMNLTHLHPPLISVHNLSAPAQPPSFVHLYRSVVSFDLRRKPSHHSPPRSTRSTRMLSLTAMAPCVHLACVQIRHDLDFASCYKIRDLIHQLFATYSPTFLLLDVTGAHNLDSTGVQMIDSIVQMSNDNGVQCVCLGGVNEKLGTRLRRSAEQRPEYQGLWEYHVVYCTSKPTLRNPDAKMILFDSVENARSFITHCLSDSKSISSFAFDPSSPASNHTSCDNNNDKANHPNHLDVSVEPVKTSSSKKNNRKLESENSNKTASAADQTSTGGMNDNPTLEQIQPLIDPGSASGYRTFHDAM
eukprot:c12642_g1_i1.p1 GENE.c12642_g1_i1~~c12642_g1_i1.p1  ORF type:complete len:909 (+),score=211.27 c12642_g1_i1:68-2794(+)